MAVFKCRMCEANLEVTGNTGIVKCEYCGTYQSVTKDETGTIRTVLIESGGHPENLLKRGNLSLEDGKWEDAEKYFDRVLDINVEESRAYIGKLLAENHVRTLEEIWQSKSWKSIKSMDNYKKAYRFADDSMKQMLDEYYTKWVYSAACAKAGSGEISDIQEAVRLFTDIIDYEDSRERAEQCKEKIYNDAVQLLKSEYGRKYSTAKSEFESIKGYRDADAKAEEYAEKAWKELEAIAEEKRREKEEKRREEEEKRRRSIQLREYQKRRQEFLDSEPGELLQAIIAAITALIIAIVKILGS